MSFTALAQCNHGEVRLVNGSTPNEGRVEVCACTCSMCSWGTVSDDLTCGESLRGMLKLFVDSLVIDQWVSMIQIINFVVDQC